jgi:hypothetical protein
MTTKNKVALGAAGVLAIALSYMAITRTNVAYPGFWRPGANGLWYPCGAAHPYLVYNQPDTNKASYQRYDYQAMLVTTNPLKLNQPAGQGANHDPQYTTNDGRLIPSFSTNRPPGYMPYPTTGMLNPQWQEGDPAYQDAGAYYKQLNPGVPYLSPSETAYGVSIATRAEWNDGNIPAFQQAKLTQCSAPPITPSTPNPTATPSPGPPSCPTCPPMGPSATQTITPVIGPAKSHTPTRTITSHIGPAPSRTHTKIPVPVTRTPVV